MNKTELSLLLYLETRAVDYGGRVAHEKMNAKDFAIIERWASQGFIEFGRIKIKDANSQGCHWVALSENAWSLAHAERRARARRMWNERQFNKTKEAPSDIAQL